MVTKKPTKLLAFSQLAGPASSFDEIELGVDKYRAYITPLAATEIYRAVYGKLPNDRQRKIFWLGAHLAHLMRNEKIAT